MRTIKTLCLIDSDNGLIGNTDIDVFPLSCYVRYTPYTVSDNRKC